MNYSKLLLNHFFSPHNVGEIEESENVVVGSAGTRGMSDTVVIYLTIHKNKITDAKFKAYGSPATIASASLATTLLKQRSLLEVGSINYQNFIDLLELPQTKWHSAVLVEDAVHAALKQRSHLLENLEVSP